VRRLARKSLALQEDWRRAMTTQKLIACAVDGSLGSEEAMRVAANLAKDLQAKLVLLHVEPKVSGEALFAPPSAPRKHPRRAEILLWESEAAELMGEQVEMQVVAGSPAKEIVAFARRSGCDLLVLGTGVKSRLSLALGSVAGAVLVQAPCPVLTVTLPREVVRAHAPKAEAADAISLP
jgi:nucleotide-binding universal stress UspA family protein